MCVGGEGFKKKSTWDTVKQLKYTEKNYLASLRRLRNGSRPLSKASKPTPSQVS